MCPHLHLHHTVLSQIGCIHQTLYFVDIMPRASLVGLHLLAQAKEVMQHLIKKIILVNIPVG